MLSLVVRAKAAPTRWCQRAQSAFPDVELHVLACFPRGPGQLIEVVRFAGRRWEAAVEDVAACPGVEDVQVLERSTEGGTARLTVPACALLAAVESSGILPRFPFEIGPGHDKWEIAATQPQAQAFLAALKAAGTDADVASTGIHADREPLTRRQREVLKRAIDEGYYDYPRRITLTGLAHKLGVAKSTLSQALMIIEHATMGRSPESRAVVRGAALTSRAQRIGPAPGRKARRKDRLAQR